MKLPQSTQVLVIGGGPAGSTAATFLAQAGVGVTLIERELFPRYHIGESLLPSCLEIVELLGARELLEAQGYQRTPGADLDWKGKAWTLDFGGSCGTYRHSYQVPRAGFDQLLLRHAVAEGVQVFEGTRVRELVHHGERPVAVRWEHGASGQIGETTFDQVVDASGRHGLIADRYLNSRRFHDSSSDVAMWGYWEGVRADLREGMPRPPGGRDGATAVGSIDHGWIWAIPFSDGRTSVGVVLHKEPFQAARQAGSLEQLYAAAIASSPLMAGLTGTGRRVSDLKVEQDYSYAAETFSGPGWFLAGDAACSLDPLLSTGVHLAMRSGLLAAAAIGSRLRGDVSEAEAAAYYEASYREAYRRCLAFVDALHQAIGTCGEDEAAEQLSHFFDDLEGPTAWSEAHAINGIHVATKPTPRLARVGSQPAARPAVSAAARA